MPPIEENNCLLKSTINSNSAKNSSFSSSTHELSSVSQINNNNSMSTPQILESGAQVNVEKKNVSSLIVFIWTYHISQYL